MEKSLLIVESPTKVRTIKKYLGPEFDVRASLGHVKDLPPNLLGVDVEHEFKPEFHIISGKNKVLKDLRQAAQKAKRIYLAPDPDREGEAIAWHIAEELADPKKEFHRVLFHELSQRAIQEALQHPEPLNENRFQSQLARRILDRLVGYQISPLLWQKVKRGLSAGRVQSVAVRLICDREKEIQAFISREYWSITALLSPEDEARTPGESPSSTFEAKLVKVQGKAAKIANQEQADRIVAHLSGESFRVTRIDRKERLRNPSAPFTTSQLQQEAFRKLRFPAKKTMFLAQRLYEGVEVGDQGLAGLITYMRTDSTRVSKEALEAVRDHISRQYGPEYLPARPLSYPNKKGAQDAHEAIRPTSLDLNPDRIAAYLEKDLLALYQLIWNRFVASQMKPAKIDQTSVDIAAGEALFRATGSILKFPGFTRVYVAGKDLTEGEASEEDKAAQLPDLRMEQLLTLWSLNPKQHFTQPPSRYTEATLVKELEEKGIGRPSTYAAIISTIQDKEYANKEKQFFRPTELGFLVTDLLVKNFPDILDVQFTSQMENNLDLIEEGKMNWIRVLENFYQPFAEALIKARAEMKQVKGLGLKTDIACPQCKQPMTIRLGKNGPFLACSGYPKCKQTMNFTRDERGKIQPQEEAPEAASEKNCPQCGKPMVVRNGKFGAFWACSGYPQCRETQPLIQGGPAPAAAAPVPTGQVCPQCGSPMLLKKNRFGGEFLACEKYPKCKTARSVETDIPCANPNCTGKLVPRMTKRGMRFYGCSRYPDCNFLLWGKPVQQPCPECQSPLLVEKTSKREGTHLACPKKECGYKETQSREDSGQGGK